MIFRFFSIDGPKMGIDCVQILCFATTILLVSKVSHLTKQNLELEVQKQSFKSELDPNFQEYSTLNKKY